MKKSTELAKLIAEKREAAKKLLTVAEGEAITQEAIDQVKTLKAEIEKLETEHAAAVELEEFASANEKALVTLNKTPVNALANVTEAKPDTTKAKAKAAIEPVYRGKLLSFKGENAYQDAYAFGMWFLASIGVEGGKQYCAENGIILQKAQNEGSNASGGYLVPHQFENMLIDLRESFGVFRRNAMVVPMTSDTRSDPRRVGGLTAYFVGESATITESNATWDRVNLTAKKIACLARITSELNEDAVIGIADYLAREIAYAFAVKEDGCGFIGDGTSTYGGIVGATTALLALSATRANIAGLQVGSGNAWSELTLADFNGVKSKLPQYAYQRGPKWYASQAFYYGVMEKLAVAAGGVTEQGIRAVAQGPMFLGYPVEIAQALPTVEANDQVAALFGALDLAATFGDRRQTSIALSEHSRFANDEIEIRGTERFDIAVHDVGNASGTANLRVPGPIVGLLTAAS